VPENSFKESPSITFLDCQPCPACDEAVFVANSADVKANTVRYRWTCDKCGCGVHNAH
jgi:ribosomal protein S27AE